MCEAPMPEPQAPASVRLGVVTICGWGERCRFALSFAGLRVWAAMGLMDELGRLRLSG
jgi:hypothetical protein